jgi:hypothetical protein
MIFDPLGLYLLPIRVLFSYIDQGFLIFNDSLPEVCTIGPQRHELHSSLTRKATLPILKYPKGDFLCIHERREIHGRTKTGMAVKRDL